MISYQLISQESNEAMGTRNVGWTSSSSTDLLRNSIPIPAHLLISDLPILQGTRLPAIKDRHVSQLISQVIQHHLSPTFGARMPIELSFIRGARGEIVVVARINSIRVIDPAPPAMAFGCRVATELGRGDARMAPLLFAPGYVQTTETLSRF